MLLKINKIILNIIDDVHQFSEFYEINVYKKEIANDNIAYFWANLLQNFLKQIHFLF